MPQCRGACSIRHLWSDRVEFHHRKEERMRRVLFCLLLLTIAAPAAGQDDRAWSAYVSTDQGSLVRIYSDGRAEPVAVKLPEGYETDYQFQPSPNGDQLAFCARV